MISFTLRCKNDHRFDSWFTSSAAFETLAASGHVACPMCGDKSVEKALMAPAIAHGEAKPHAKAEVEAKAAEMIAQMRQMVEENSDYVGMNFAAEARAMHLGDMPARAIYGEAKADEAKSLIEDGIPVAPLPFIPRAKTN
jgi:hypothetical protein